MDKPRSTAICLDNVSYYGDASQPPVLNQVSLHIPEGQWVAIVGRNGSGKSTLIRLMNGLLAASSGTIRVCDIPLHSETVWEVRKRIGMVFANPDNQFIGQTVAEDIVFGLENRGLDPAMMRDRLRHYASLLEITPLLNRHPSYLSGGQKQRVAIAATLAMEPDILLFDEASSMLDSHSKLEILGIMRRMKEQGHYTLVSITHDREEMAAADRMLVLADGAIIADGKPNELMKSAKLLGECRLEAPYTLQLCRELRRKGIDIGEHLDGKEVLDALWEYNLTMSPIAMKKASKII